MDEEEYNKLSLKIQKRYRKVSYHDERGILKVNYILVPPSPNELWEMWEKVYSLDMDN